MTRGVPVPPPPRAYEVVEEGDDFNESSPVRSVDSILEGSFKGAVGDLERDPNAFLDYMARARE